MTNISLHGFDELTNALNNAEALFIPLASSAMAIAIEAIYEEISPYPPQPDRMRSGRLNTYVRGVGSYPKSAFIADTSQPGGFRTKKVKNTQVKMTSQQMDKKYKLKVSTTKQAVLGELTNDASYSGWVVGPPMGTPHQVGFHAETGWPNEDDAIEAARPKIEDALNQAVQVFIHRLAEVV